MTGATDVAACGAGEQCGVLILSQPSEGVVAGSCTMKHVLPVGVQVRARQLWGTDVYTDDSDLVAGEASASPTSATAPLACPLLLVARSNVQPLLAVSSEGTAALWGSGPPALSLRCCTRGPVPVLCLRMQC